MPAPWGDWEATFGAVVDPQESRARLLRAALGFLSLEPRDSELRRLHRCFDTWRGIGDVVAGMARQGYDLELGTSPLRWARLARDVLSRRIRALEEPRWALTTCGARHAG